MHQAHVPVVSSGPILLLDALAERVIFRVEGVRSGKVGSIPENPVESEKESSCP
jgi:hypothetical protein